MRQKKILYVDWGGLGDHLQFSTLPEAFDKYGFDFYLNESSKFRNPKILDLVWKNNPYFKGLTNESPNCGHISQSLMFNHNLSINRNWEITYQVDNNSEYSKIYYKPKNLQKYNEHILLDLNSFSITDYNQQIIQNYIDLLGDVKLLSIVTESDFSKSVVNSDFYNHFKIEFIKTIDIFHYCDLIYSSKKFICVWSGSSVLASAIKNYFKKNLEVVCFNSHKNILDWGISNKSYFWYDNIKYITC